MRYEWNTLCYKLIKHHLNVKNILFTLKMMKDQNDENENDENDENDQIL